MKEILKNVRENIMERNDEVQAVNFSCVNNRWTVEVSVIDLSFSPRQVKWDVLEVMAEHGLEVGKIMIEV